MVSGIYCGGNRYNPQVYSPYNSLKEMDLTCRLAPQSYFNTVTTQYKSEKVGFWEGIKAFGKGLVKPFTEIIKHPIKSILMIAAGAVICSIPGGAPLLIAGGLALGAFQIGKGAYKFATSNNRKQTLTALEDMGSGTTTVGLSAFGAKAYMGKASFVNKNLAVLGKDATISAKSIAYIKGLGQDSIAVLQETKNNLFSGEAWGNAFNYIKAGKVTSPQKAVDDSFTKVNEIKTKYDQYLRITSHYREKLMNTNLSDKEIAAIQAKLYSIPNPVSISGTAKMILKSQADLAGIAYNANIFNHEATSQAAYNPYIRN